MGLTAYTMLPLTCVQYQASHPSYMHWYAFLIGRHHVSVCVFVQAQLHTLACICWSEPCPVSHALQLNTVSAAQSVRQLQHNTATDMKQCRWTQEGFPKGPALLTHLHTELTDADSDFAPLLRELMLAAIQPYMQHVRSWLYSTAAVLPGLVSGDVDDLNGMQALHAVVNKSRTSEVRYITGCT